MNAWRTLLGTAAVAFAVTSNAATLAPVIDSFTLTDLLENNQAKVLEIRSDEKAYLNEHIPGSCTFLMANFEVQTKIQENYLN